MEQCDSRVILKDSTAFKKSLDDPPDNPPNGIPYRNSDYQFVMPNEMYISLGNAGEVVAPPMVDGKEGFLGVGYRSTPASPEETERTRNNKQMKKDLSSFHSPILDKKLPYSGFSAVRTSKSEDHLRKSSLTTVNIDIEDELASSLDTLLDTKGDEDVFEMHANNELSNSCPDDKTTTTHDHQESKSPAIDQESPHPQSNSCPPAAADEPLSKSSSEPSKGSVKEEAENESSGSEIIPSAASSSSSTIRRGEECTSEQISAISSLDDATDASVGSLSPEETEMDDGWADIDTRECVMDVFQDITNRSKPPPRATSTSKLPDLPLDSLRPPPSGDRSPPSPSSSFSVPKSPPSLCSEDTFGDLSYHELTESYDEVSAMEPAEQQQQPVVAVTTTVNRCESPGTEDDESDIESLHSFHYSPKAVDIPSAVRLAKRLYALDGFKKTDVSRHLSKNNEFNRAVAEEYVKYFDFTGNTLDMALRKFLGQFCLVGETQERERVLVHFSKRYLDCNPDSFKSQDSVHTLTCAIMLLNTDLHGESNRRKMMCAEFVQNLAELNDGENYPRDVLKVLYYSIKTHPLEWALEGDDLKKTSKDKSSSDYRQNFSCHNPFLEVPNPNCATEYKKGYVMRKCCIDPSGKKTALGRRSWKMLYATLRDLVLYLHKDEHGFKKNQLYESLHNSIRIHHAFAAKAVDYTKKQYVFRLHTADQAEYLFQTSDSKELDSWVDTINLVTASLSAPPLPCGVGVQRKFQRPLLPVSHTKHNLREQLQDHDTRIIWLEKEYEELITRTPEKSLKSRFAHDYAERETHLQYELTRYRTYAFLLRTRMAQYPELETPLVQTSIGELEEPVEKTKTPNSPKNSPSKSSTQPTILVESCSPEKLSPKP